MISAVQMGNLRGLLFIRRMDRVPNARIRDLCGVAKVVDEILMKVFFDGLAIWKGWRMVGLLRESM